MEKFTFVPWYHLSPVTLPSTSPKNFPMYFVGIYRWDDTTFKMYVREEKYWQSLRSLYTFSSRRGHTENSWTLQKAWTLYSGDPAHDRLRWLHDYVLQNWWQIVTSGHLVT